LATIDGPLDMPARRAARADEPSWTTPAEILESIGEAFYALDRQWRFVYVNRMAEQLWGRRREDLLGQVATAAFPAWIGTESHAAHERALQSGRPVSIQTTSAIVGAAVEINIFPRAGGLSVYFRDISARQRMERELREREETLSMAETSAGIGVWDMDMTTHTVRATAQFFRIVGIEPTDQPVPIERLRALRHPDDRDQVVNNFARALEGGNDQYEAEYRIIRPDGEVRWIFGRGRVFRDAGGTPVRYSGVDIDITDRKRAEEHLALTTRELSHRTKNILAVVQAMVRQIGKQTENFEDFEQRLSGCITALAYCHDLLFASDWQGADLMSLVALQMTPFGGLDGRKFVATGPALTLGPQATQLIGLALHELATNAAKHGALTTPAGTVAIAWHAEQPGADIRLTWQERNGPPVAPPTRRGFGHTVLERMAQSLDAKVSLEFLPGGLRWSLLIGAAHIMRATT
jgi:PAS domain S-box-containing protein